MTKSTISTIDVRLDELPPYSVLAQQPTTQPDTPYVTPQRTIKSLFLNKNKKGFWVISFIALIHVVLICLCIYGAHEYIYWAGNNNNINDHNTLMSYVNQRYDSCSCTALTIPQSSLKGKSERYYNIAVQCELYNTTLTSEFPPLCFKSEYLKSENTCKLILPNSKKWNDPNDLLHPYDGTILYGISASPQLSFHNTVFGATLGAIGVVLCSGSLFYNLASYSQGKLIKVPLKEDGLVLCLVGPLVCFMFMIFLVFIFVPDRRFSYGSCINF